MDFSSANVSLWNPILQIGLICVLIIIANVLRRKVVLLLFFFLLQLIIDFSLKNGDVYAIPEEDTIYINGNNIEIIGTKPYYEFKDGLYEKFDIEKISKINLLSFHDTKIPTEEPLAIKFINDNINYNYLKLVESVLYVLILPIAIQTRIARNAQTDKLDVWNCIEEIRNTSFSYIIDCYNNTIRNGVAHGTVAYSAYNITYFDKKGNIYTDNVNQVVGLFDMLLDNCNAMMAALKCIMIKHSTFFYEHEIKIPSSYLIQELNKLRNLKLNIKLKNTKKLEKKIN